MSGESIGAKTVKARKRHRCWWCWGWIEPKTTYRRWAWVADGHIDAMKCHPECCEAWHEASEHEFGGYETGPGEHERGCQCQKGWCQCEPSKTE